MVLTLLCTALGFLSGLGVGGGSLLMLWLTAVQGIGRPEARMLNLLFFVPAALIACLFHHRQGRLPLKKLLPVLAAACAGAAGACLLPEPPDPALLQRLFGYLLLVTGVRELLYRPR